MFQLRKTGDLEIIGLEVRFVDAGRFDRVQRLLTFLKSNSAPHTIELLHGDTVFDSISRFFQFVAKSRGPRHR